MKKSLSEILSLSGKVAIVTGGAMGIGKGIVYRLAEAGAKVIIADVNFEKALETEKELSSSGLDVKAVNVDVSKMDELDNLIAKTVEIFGDIDILINNAGIFNFMPALDLTEELWDRTLDINLKGSMFLSQKVAKVMVEKEHGGSIVNIASIDGYKPTGNLVHYDASKGGMVMMTKSLAKDLAVHKIWVNGIAPGGIATPGVAAVMGGSEITEEAAKKATEAFASNLPMKRIGEPDDIAKVTLFLVSEMASYITGETIIVDGGALL